MNTLTKGLCASAVLLALVSCGGGGSDVAGGGIGGTGISQGPITGFGSVIVNGIKFEDAGAAIEIEDVPDSQRIDLKVGMVVKIAWERDTAGIYTARSIVYDDDVQGPVRNLNVNQATGDATFTVLGQQIITQPATTAFDVIPTAAALTNGTVVEVSGLRNGTTGAIHATRIEVKTGADAAEYELKGIVSAVTSGTTFTLGSGVAVGVIYSGDPVVQTGDCVEVKSSQDIVGTQLTATSVKAEDSCTPGGEGQELALKGYPSAIDRAVNTFTVNGRQVNYSSATFPPGKSAADLSETAIIEVEGSLSGGVLVARKISFEVEGGFNVTGSVQGRITTDTLTLTGVTPATFTVNNLTVYEDDSAPSATPIPNFGKASIEPGHILKVYYYTDTTTRIHVATRIKREG